MAIGREALLGMAHAERQRLGRMIQFAEPETWELPSAAAGWWNRDVMAHLGAGDTAAAQLVAGEAAEELDAYREQLGEESFTVDGWNAWTVARRAGSETRELLDVWGRAAESLLEYAARLDDDEWRDARYPWIAGDIAPKYLLQSRVIEWFLHGEDMRATNGVAQGWQIGVDLRGRSVQVDVSGAGEGSWHWGLGAGEVPDPDHKPDALIVGRAPQFALVAGKRLSPDDVLAAGTVVLGGDVDVADLIVRTIRAYP